MRCLITTAKDLHSVVFSFLYFALYFECFIKNLYLAQKHKQAAHYQQTKFDRQFPGKCKGKSKKTDP